MATREVLDAARAGRPRRSRGPGQRALRPCARAVPADARQRADALDATQDTLVAAIRALGRFDGRSSFGDVDLPHRHQHLYRRDAPPASPAHDGDRGRHCRGRRRGLVRCTGSVRPPRHDDAIRHDEDAAETPAGDRDVGHRLRSPERGGGKTARDQRFGGGPDPADVVAARVDIDAALSSLPFEFRAAIVLRDVCDLPYDEIATILGVPVGRFVRASPAPGRRWPRCGRPKSLSVVVRLKKPRHEPPGTFSASPIVRTTKSDAPRSQEEGHTR